MRLPFVSRLAFDLAMSQLERTQAELASLREVNERYMGSALLARGVPNPFDGRPVTSEVSRPVGRATAEATLRALEAADMKMAIAKQKEADAAPAN